MGRHSCHTRPREQHGPELSPRGRCALWEPRGCGGGDPSEVRLVDDRAGPLTVLVLLPGTVRVLWETSPSGTKFWEGLKECFEQRMRLTGVHRPHLCLEVGPSISLPCPEQAEPLGPDPVLGTSSSLNSFTLCKQGAILGMQLGLLNCLNTWRCCGRAGRDPRADRTPRPPRGGAEGSRRCREVTPSQDSACLVPVPQGAAVPGNALSSPHHLQGGCRTSREGSWGASPPKTSAVAAQCAAGGPRERMGRAVSAPSWPQHSSRSAGGSGER